MTQNNKALQEAEQILDTSSDGWEEELDKYMTKDLKAQNYQKLRAADPKVKASQRIYNQRENRKTRISRLYHSGNMTAAEAGPFIDSMKKDRNYVPDLSKWSHVHVSMDDIVNNS